MNLFSRLGKNIRDRIMPVQTFQVEVLVWYEFEDRPIGSFQVKVEARTKMAARKRAMSQLSLKADRCKAVKKQVNGKPYGRDH